MIEESKKPKNDIRIRKFLERWNNEIENIKHQDHISKDKRNYMLLLFESDKIKNVQLYVGDEVYTNEDIHDCEIRLEAALNLKVNDENLILRIFDKVREVTVNLFSVKK